MGAAVHGGGKMGVKFAFHFRVRCQDISQAFLSVLLPLPISPLAVLSWLDIINTPKLALAIKILPCMVVRRMALSFDKHRGVN